MMYQNSKLNLEYVIFELFNFEYKELYVYGYELYVILYYILYNIGAIMDLNKSMNT